MNDLSDLISADAIDASVSVTNKKALFQQLASSAARLTGLPAKEILACLQQRERLSSTGFGGGVAIPHGKIEGLKGIVGFFARLNAPIDYRAVDNMPVDLVFLLLSTPDAGADHLKALARVSRALRDRTAVAKLRGARSKDAIFALLAGMKLSMPRDEPAQAGAAAHFRALEALYRSAPVNGVFQSTLEIVEEGFARIRFLIDERSFHAAGAAHGTIYFKMLDDAAFYACNSLVTDRFLLTTAFNLHFTRPLRGGDVIAEGRWVSGRRRVFVGDARLIDSDGEEAARGTGTFMRSHIPLSGLAGYRPDG